jgi:hypothetical protein
MIQESDVIHYLRDKFQGIGIDEASIKKDMIITSNSSLLMLW